MGVGVCALKDRAALLSPRADRAARIVLVFLILAVPVHAALRIKHWYRLGYPHLVRAETVSNQISDRGDLFLCNDYSAFVSLYHLHRRGWGFDFERTVPARIDEVESIVRQGARFLFTAKNGVFRDPGHFWSQTFRRFPVAYEDDNILVFKLAPSNEESAR